MTDYRDAPPVVTTARITLEARVYGYSDQYRLDVFRRGYAAGLTGDWAPDPRDYGTLVAWRHGYACGMAARKSAIAEGRR